jgi:hypothetical protein
MDELAMFDLPEQPKAALHACTGSTCGFCASTPDALAAKAAGMKAAADAKLEWLARCDTWRQTLTYATRITADDLIAACGLPVGELAAGKNNAVGALFSSWARQGHLVRVDYVQSRRKSSHGHVIAVWEVI